jgi:hypothetical protein
MLDNDLDYYVPIPAGTTLTFACQGGEQVPGLQTPAFDEPLMSLVRLSGLL